eukprot:TRINITY_DN2920_c0_g1_i1.p1 TRINITY_DN2920_c0_g1~~TRINITY_DN2920_c0_g1_i1.p1  ORF type:complete len:215 (+),score=59.05 TRINITY_DN2920_c0_g1_i1:145-789(+)
MENDRDASVNLLQQMLSENVDVGKQGQIPRAPAPTLLHTPEPSAQLRVLVADDNNVALNIASGLLRTMGYKAFPVSDGKQAAEKYLADPDKYDCILMDLDMPKMNGFEATAEIRANEDANEHVPIFAVTARSFGDTEDKCLQAGMDGYLTKPIRSNHLMRKLRNVALGPSGNASNQPVSHDVLMSKLNALASLQSKSSDDYYDQEDELEEGGVY